MSFILYLTSAATSPYSKMVKLFFHGYFSFSNKVFYPVAYIMNGLQHLTTPTGLKFCLALCFSSGPNSSKFGPSFPQVSANMNPAEALGSRCLAGCPITETGCPIM